MTMTNPNINLTGSLQNPAFSPDGTQLVFTRFRGGYNIGRSDIAVCNLDGSNVGLAVSADAQSVNLPGLSCWSASNDLFCCSSDIGDKGDQIWVSDPWGARRQVTHLANAVAWEPSFSPTGDFLAYEGHGKDGVGNGGIFVVDIDGVTHTRLTDSRMDAKQPNWSPTYNHIVFQIEGNGLWTVLPDGTGLSKVITGPGEATDASFSKDGAQLVYSGDGNSLDHSTVFIVDMNTHVVTKTTAVEKGSYAGAPCFSPNGKLIAFEYCVGDPEGGKGTKIGIISLP
jgi:TolB protein